MNRQKIGLVYYSASLLGHKITWTKAIEIADAFTLEELTRIYLRIKATGTRRVYDKKVA